MATCTAGGRRHGNLDQRLHRAAGVVVEVAPVVVIELVLFVL